MWRSSSPTARRKPTVSAESSTAAPGRRSGVIHDIGYQHYDGPRLGRPAIVRALCWHSLRSAFGIGRGIKAKIVPVITFVIMCLPAVANAVSVANGTPRSINYDTYIFQLRVLVMIIFIAAQAPELVSRDLRSHVLPLYFSRPLRRLDYPLAKLAAFILACRLAGLLDSVSTGQGHPFRGGQVATTGARLSGLVSPFTVLDGVRQWLGGTSPGPIPPPGSYGPLYGVMLLVLLGLAVGGLAVRYRKAGVA